MKMLLFFSHHLTDEQKADAKNMGIDKFVSLPRQLQYLWSNIPPELDDIGKYSEEFCVFLKRNAEAGDYVLIQGDFGLTCRLSVYAKKIGVIPVYATTKRKVTERIEGDKIIKTSEFKHIRFRKY